MDGIAVAGDIEVLLDKIYEAIVRRDEVEAARLIGLARKRAGRIKEINREMKRKGEA